MKDLHVELDSKATELARDYLRTEGRLLSLLMEMRAKKVFAVLNYSGIYDYCLRRLNFSRAQSFYFKYVALKAEEVPEIKEAILREEITLSQARRIVPVITKANQEEWIEKAKVLPQKELEREVATENPNAHIVERIRPVAKELSELKVSINRETEENIDFLKEILSQKMGKPASLADVVAWMAKEMREKFDPIKKAERAAKISSRKSASVSAKPGRHPIQAAVHHPVMLRDEMRCTYVSADGRRCEERRWLQRHHLVEVAHGGLNTVENLRLLCSAHHWLVHDEASVASAFGPRGRLAFGGLRP